MIHVSTRLKYIKLELELEFLSNQKFCWCIDSLRKRLFTNMFTNSSRIMIHEQLVNIIHELDHKQFTLRTRSHNFQIFYCVSLVSFLKSINKLLSNNDFKNLINQIYKYQCIWIKLYYFYY